MFVEGKHSKFKINDSFSEHSTKEVPLNLEKVDGYYVRMKKKICIMNKVFVKFTFEFSKNINIHIEIFDSSSLNINIER